MEKEFFEILTIGEQAEIINNLDDLKETGEEIGVDKKPVGKTLSRENFKDDKGQKLFKINKHFINEDKKQTTDMDIDEISIQKLKNAINIDELSNQRLKSAINMEELSNQRLTSAINIEEQCNLKLINSSDMNVEEIKKISQNISELKEMLNNLKYQDSNNNNQVSTNIMQSLKNLPNTIETLERTFKINLDVAEIFDKFYEDNKGFRVQDLISLALLELINKYK